MKTLSALSLFCAVALVSPAAQADRVLLNPDRCVEPKDPQIQAKSSAFSRASAESLKAALAAKGLTKIPVRMDVETLHKGARGKAVNPRKDEPGMVRGPSYWQGSPGTKAVWSFVQDKRGVVYRLIKAPKPERTEVLHLCGCLPWDCNNGSPCGACPETVQIWYGPLPKGSQYGGEVTVEYAVLTLEHTYEKGRCRNRCYPKPGRAPRAR